MLEETNGRQELFSEVLFMKIRAISRDEIYSPLPGKGEMRTRHLFIEGILCSAFRQKREG